jgi:hypothetical protein
VGVDVILDTGTAYSASHAELERSRGAEQLYDGPHRAGAGVHCGHAIPARCA